MFPFFSSSGIVQKLLYISSATLTITAIKEDQTFQKKKKKKNFKIFYAFLSFFPSLSSSSSHFTFFKIFFHLLLKWIFKSFFLIFHCPFFKVFFSCFSRHYSWSTWLGLISSYTQIPLAKSNQNMSLLVFKHLLYLSCIHCKFYFLSLSCQSSYLSTFSTF